MARDRSASMRIELMTSAWHGFKAQPLFGSGFEERTSGYYPHNVVVEAFMATGMLGGVIFLLLIAMTLRAALRLMLARDSQSWLAVLCIQYLVAAQFSGALYASMPMWGLMCATMSRHVAVGRANLRTVRPNADQARASKVAPRSVS
jgi:O-antigen ligase